MNAEERFLKDATRGLRGQARRDAQTELRSHLHERTQQLLLSGSAEPAARAQALGELGPPRLIARGLARQHTVHPGLSLGTLLVLAVVAYPAGLAIIDRTYGDFTPSAWVNPCQGRARCETVDSVNHPTDDDYLRLGLIPARTAATIFTGTDVRVTGFLWKSVALAGYPSLPMDTFLSDVGWDNHRGVRHGYLNVVDLLMGAVQQGWPIKITGTGARPSIEVNGRVLGTDSAQIARLTMAQHLKRQMDRGLTHSVSLAASVTENHDSPRSSAYALPSVLPSSGWPLQVPDSSRNYALIQYRTPETGAGGLILPGGLSAIQLPADERGQFWVPFVVMHEGAPTRLVHSQAHFLSMVRAGEDVAMLVEVPRDLKLAAGFKVVALQERNLRVQ